VDWANLQNRGRSTDYLTESEGMISRHSHYHGLGQSAELRQEYTLPYRSRRNDIPLQPLLWTGPTCRTEAGVQTPLQEQKE